MSETENISVEAQLEALVRQCQAVREDRDGLAAMLATPAGADYVAGNVREFTARRDELAKAARELSKTIDVLNAALRKRKRWGLRA